MTTRVPKAWITRTQPGADASELLWREAGFDAHAAPLLTLQRVTDDEPIPDNAALIFTSANGARFCPEIPRDRRVYCIGPATAEAAHDAGFTDIRFGVGDWRDLLQIVEPSAAPIVHVGGRHVRGQVSETLQSWGRDASRRVVYGSMPVTRWPVEPGFYDLACLYSPLASETLAALPDRPMPPRIIALSENVAAPIRERFPACRVVVADVPTDGAMIDAARFAVGDAEG